MLVTIAVSTNKFLITYKYNCSIKRLKILIIIRHVDNDQNSILIMK